MVVDAAAARVADDDLGAGRGVQRLEERRLGRVGEIEDDTALGEAPDELAPRVGQALLGRVEPARERVRVVPGQRDHPHAGVPELVERLRVAV